MVPSQLARRGGHPCTRSCLRLAFGQSPKNFLPQFRSPNRNSLNTADFTLILEFEPKPRRSSPAPKTHAASRMSRPADKLQLPGLNPKMPRSGLESSRFPAGNTPVSHSGGSKSGNKDASFAVSAGVPKSVDPDLAAVVAAWPALPAAIRAGVLAMVRATGVKP